MAYRLARDVSFTFQRLHKCSARKGAPVRKESGHFCIEPAHVETDSDRGPRTLWAHDTHFYFIWVRPEDVEQVPA